jgi:hypothetical protein
MFGDAFMSVPFFSLPSPDETNLPPKDEAELPVEDEGKPL